MGVFSPSHRNHYLNVTPNNLLRIYAPDGISLSSAQLPPLVLVSTATGGLKNRNSTVQCEICHPEKLRRPVSCPLKTLSLFAIQEPMLRPPARPPSALLREPVSRMQLMFDEEDDEGLDGGKCSERGEDSKAPGDTRGGSSRGPRQPSGNTAAQDSGWDAGGASNM